MSDEQLLTASEVGANPADNSLMASHGPVNNIN
jgi:hypothetical protein